MGKCNVCGKEAGYLYSLCEEHRRPSEAATSSRTNSSRNAEDSKFSHGTSKENSLRFKSNVDAFKYACEFLNCQLEIGASVPALVICVVSSRDGMSEVELQLSGSPMPPTLLTYVPNSVGLQNGDFVSFRIMASRPFPPGPFGIPEYVLMPQYVVKEGGWRVQRMLLKSNTQHGV